MNFPEWSHLFVDRKPFEGEWYRKPGYIEVTAGLRYITGNPKPYFSVTAQIWEGRRKEPSAFGAIHPEVLRHWPRLAPVVDLHLSDADGVPMHAKDNGWYWLAGYYGGAGERFHGGEKGKTTCLEVLAMHVRVPLDAMRTLADTWEHATPNADEVKPIFIGWVDQQVERWQHEADDARDLLDTLAAEMGARRVFR